MQCILHMRSGNWKNHGGRELIPPLSFFSPPDTFSLLVLHFVLHSCLVTGYSCAGCTFALNSTLKVAMTKSFVKQLSWTSEMNGLALAMNRHVLAESGEVTFHMQGGMLLISRVVHYTQIDICPNITSCATTIWCTFRLVDEMTRGKSRRVTRA